MFASGDLSKPLCSPNRIFQKLTSDHSSAINHKITNFQPIEETIPHKNITLISTYSNLIHGFLIGIYSIYYIYLFATLTLIPGIVSDKGATRLRRSLTLIIFREFLLILGSG